MNKIQANILIPGLVTAGIALQPFAVNSMFKLHPTKDNLVKFVMFGVLLVECSLLLVVLLGGMAEIYQQSCASFNMFRKCMALKYKENQKDVKWQTKFFRSCGYMKVKFGSINFIDNCTALVCMDFANNLSLQLLLISK